jgi:trans-aconitate methyltransferase
MIRRAFGRHERLVSEAWRAIFVSLDDWTRLLHEWAPGARHILELGCGEGYSTERLVATFPEAWIEAIDVSPNLGRLYAGPAERVRFRQMFAEELAAEAPASFDLIILSDVMHHVPVPARASLLSAAKALLAPGGVLAFKDWHRSATPIHAAVHASDRLLTGDRVAYMTRKEARVMLETAFGAGCITGEGWVRPWRANYAMRVIPR